jgi:hypothetical protein
MNISLSHKHVLGIIGTAALIALAAFLLPKAFVHGDVAPSSVGILSVVYEEPDLLISWNEPTEPGDGVDLHYNITVIPEGSLTGESATTSTTSYTFSV